MGVATMRTGAGHLVEAQLGAGRDHQVVVVNALAVGQGEPVGIGLYRRDRLGNEAYALALEQRRDLERDVLALAPVHRDPGVRGRELEIVHRTDHRDLVLLGQEVAQFVGSRHAADACANDNDMGHGLSPLLGLG